VSSVSSVSFLPPRLPLYAIDRGPRMLLSGMQSVGRGVAKKTVLIRVNLCL